MKTLEMKINDGFEKPYTVEFAVNNDGTGLFTRNTNDGTWIQHAGTGQFYARTPKELARKIRAWSTNWESAKMVRGSANF